MSLLGHDAALGVASKERIFVKCDNCCEKVTNFDKLLEKVVRNFRRRIVKILVND